MLIRPTLDTATSDMAVFDSDTSSAAPFDPAVNLWYLRPLRDRATVLLLVIHTGCYALPYNARITASKHSQQLIYHWLGQGTRLQPRISLQDAPQLMGSEVDGIGFIVVAHHITFWWHEFVNPA